MNTKKKTWLAGVCVLAVIIVALLVIQPWKKLPFKSLTVDEISSMTVKLTPPDITLNLTETDIAEFVKIANSCAIYSVDNSYSNYAGQGVLFSIVKKDGTTIEVMAYNPFLIIDGIGYRTSYAPCEKLNFFGNKIASKNS